MGTVTLTVVGDVSVGTKAKTYNFTDADINRLVAWTKKAFATVPTNAVPNPPALTTTQSLVAWADSFINTTKTNVINTERNTTITAVPTPINIVIT